MLVEELFRNRPGFRGCIASSTDFFRQWFRHHHAMKSRRYLLGTFVVALAVGLDAAAGPKVRTWDGVVAIPPAADDADASEFSFLEEAQYRLWQKGRLRTPGGGDRPNFKFLIRLINESITFDSVWTDNTQGGPATGEPAGGLTLITGSGQTVVEQECASDVGETQ